MWSVGLKQMQAMLHIYVQICTEYVPQSRIGRGDQERKKRRHER
jgi:hypothetical protein